MRSAAIFISIALGLLENARGLLHDGTFKTASIKQFPYYASIEVKGKNKCAATVIDDFFVMTTHSCVQGMDVNDLDVRVGTASQGQRGAYFKVVDVVPWKGNPYIGPSPDIPYDLAMVKIAVPFIYEPHVMWANPNTDGIKELQEGTVAGWTDPKTPGSPLVSAKAFVLPSSNCSQIYSGMMNISEGMYCLWPSDPSRHTCFADMGAPFYFNEQYYGMVTYSPGCDNQDLPLVITEIAQFTSFIITVLCDLEKIFGQNIHSIANSFGVQDLLPSGQSLTVR